MKFPSTTRPDRPPRRGATVASFAIAGATAAALAWGAVALPHRMAASMDLAPGTYAMADLLTLRGAVEEADLGVLSATAASQRDFGALVAQATAGGHGSLQYFAAAR